MNFKLFNKIFFILLACALFAHCVNTSSGGEKSRVLYLQYGGSEDSVYAFLHGQVFEENSNMDLKDSLLPLPGVEIHIESDSPGFIKAYTTDHNGEFSIPLNKGTYNLSFNKNEYQPLKVTNYIADPDHSAHTKIILVKE